MTILQSTDPLWNACEALLLQIHRDHASGMISQRTMVLCDELRRQLARDQEREAREELEAV